MGHRLQWMIGIVPGMVWLLVVDFMRACGCGWYKQSYYPKVGQGLAAC